MIRPKLISINPPGIGGSGVFIPNSSPLSKCVIDEIIHEISGHDSDKSIKFNGSIWGNH